MQTEEREPVAAPGLKFKPKKARRSSGSQPVFHFRIRIRIFGPQKTTPALVCNSLHFLKIKIYIIILKKDWGREKYIGRFTARDIYLLPGVRDIYMALENVLGQFLHLISDRIPDINKDRIYGKSLPCFIKHKLQSKIGIPKGSRKKSYFF